MDRRHFLETLAAAALIPLKPAAPDRLGRLLPLRRLGKTGVQVTMLGVGGWHIGRMSERDAQETIETALEGGVRFFDSAEAYQKGRSEEYLGRFLTPKYRDVSFLMTKTGAKTAAEARQDLDDSLRRMNTDYLDLWQAHEVMSADDADARIEGGVVDVMVEAKAAGKVRHIGFTGHARPSGHRRMLERTDVFETIQMPVNVLDPAYDSFITQVLPAALERDMGVIAMKTLSNGHFFRSQGPIPTRLNIEEALRYVWSLPVGVLVTGPDNAAMLQEKIHMARQFTPLDETRRDELAARVADLAGRQVEYYKQV